MVADATAVRSPDRAERTILGVILAGYFFANSGHFCGRRDTLRCRNPLLSSNIFNQGHLLKIEWLVTDVTAIGSPDRAERAILGGPHGWECFWQIEVVFVVGEPLGDVGTSS